MISSAELTWLWRRHSAALLLLARSRCGAAIGQAEDCVQEAFIRLASQATTPNDCIAWLARVVRNAAIDAARSQRRRNQYENAATCTQTLLFEPAQVLSDRPQTEELQLALQALDEETRDIVVAHVWNDMTFRQIADAFAMSAATVHRRYEAGIDTLRESLRQSNAALEKGTQNHD